MTTGSADPAILARRLRAITHPVRQRLFYRYGREITSPSRIATAVEMPVNLVSYHTRVLLEAGLLELVRVEPRRGAREHFYRAVGLGEIEDADWERLPVPARRSNARLILEQIWDDATNALPRGGLDDGRTHISRQLLRLDDQARSELAALLRATADAAGDIERASGRRAQSEQSLVEVAILKFTTTSEW